MIGWRVEGVIGGYRTLWTSHLSDSERADFISGVRRCYGAHDASSALPADARDGAERLHFLVRDHDGGACAGFSVRLCRATDVSIVEPWGLEAQRVRARLIDAVGDAGVVAEACCAWADRASGQRDVAQSGGDVTPSDILAAQPPLVFGLLFPRTRAMVCISADHSVGRWLRSGARPVDGVDSAPWPDARYATVPLCWRREGLARRMDGRLAAIALSQMESQGFSMSVSVWRMFGYAQPHSLNTTEGSEGVSVSAFDARVRAQGIDSEEK